MTNPTIIPAASIRPLPALIGEPEADTCSLYHQVCAAIERSKSADVTTWSMDEFEHLLHDVECGSVTGHEEWQARAGFEAHCENVRSQPR